MTYKIIEEKNLTRVEILGLSSSQEQKLSHEMFPFIIESTDPPTHTIMVQKANQDFFMCEGNTLYIEYLHDSYLYKVTRRSIRDILYQNYLENGYMKFHAASVEKDGRVTLLMGPKRSGKTSMALGLCKYCDYSLIDGDLTLIKDNHIMGWATAIGTRNKTSEILGIEYSKDIPFTWQWPIEMIERGYKMSFQGNLQNIIIPKFNFNEQVSHIRLLNKQEKEKYLLENIHYEEINKENYWNKPLLDISIMPQKVLENKKLLNTEMIQYETNGLTEENVKRLEKVLRRENK